MNEGTGRRGRIGSLPIRALFTRESSDPVLPKCPEANERYDKGVRPLLQESPGNESESKLENLEAECELALKVYMAEAEQLHVLLRHFTWGLPQADQKLLAEQGNRELRAYAAYLLARHRLIEATIGYVFSALWLHSALKMHVPKPLSHATAKLCVRCPIR
jgi:hypothetical protein